MNWYFEEQGVSKGPYEEAEFAQMVQRREVPADALVWKPDMSEWAAVAEVNPAWLKSGEKEDSTTTAKPSRSVREAGDAVAKKPSETASAKGARTLSEDAPIIEAAVPTEPPAPARPATASKLKLQAPTPAPPEPAQPEKAGLLKRVFGFGRKK